MKLRHVVAAAVLALVACAHAPQPTSVTRAADESNRKARALNATVILTGCGGTFIGPREIATAAHCVEDSELGDAIPFLTREQWLAGDLNFAFATLVRLDLVGDVALLAAAADGPAHVALGKTPAIGSHVQSIGHPDQEFYTVSAGIVTRLGSMIEGRPYTVVMIPIWYGSSGGGLFDSQWRLIGVTSRMNSEGTIGSFVPAERVRVTGT